MTTFFDRVKSCKGPKQTLQDFIRALGVAETTFYGWGRGQEPKLDRIRGLAKLLGVRAGWLAFEEGPKEVVAKKRRCDSTIPNSTRREV